MAIAQAKFGRVDRVALRDKIAHIIQEAILSGQYTPGDRIVEMTVAEQMNVGQNTIREALQVLEHQFLVTKIPHLGTFVTKLSDEEVSQIYRVRLELEPLAAELAAERLDEKSYQSLEKIADRMATCARLGDYKQYVRSDFDLHEAIWELSGNRFLVKALQTITPPLFAYILIRNFHIAGNLQMAEELNSHAKMVRILSGKDAHTARQYSRELMQRSWEQTVRNLQT